MKKLLKTTRKLRPEFKFDLKMKLSTLLVMVTFFSLKANDSYAQRTKITLSLNKATVGQVIDEIESSTEFQFVYKIEDVDLDRTVSITADNENIVNILNQIFNNSSTTYNLNERRIYLLKPTNIPISKPQKVEINVPIFQEVIKGSIKDKDGNPLPGASILEKGTTNGVQSDFDGNYSITITNRNATLIFSYIGFATNEIAINDQTTVNVVLQEDAASLDEVVVVGYGTKNRSDLLGAQSTVSSQDLGSQTITSAGQALSGRVPGIQIIQGSGQPGKDNPVIQIRGVGTIRQSVDGQNTDSGPLVIVDGIQATFDDVHPQDIENISVLKDASSAAIYGARAANGVILITTKRGRSAKPRITLNSYFAWQRPTEIPEVLNPFEFATLRNEAQANVGRPPVYTEAQIEWFRGFKEESFAKFGYIKDAPLMNHHLAVSGGAENVKYMFSIGYQDQEGIVLNTESQRYNIRSNVDVTISKQIKAGINVGGSFIKSVEPNYDMFGVTQLIRDMIRHPPVVLVEGLFQEDGFYSNGSAEIGVTHSGTTIAAAEVGGKDTDRIFRATPSIYLEYSPIPDLTIRSSASMFITQGRRTRFRAPFLVSDGVNLTPRNGIGELRESFDGSRQSTVETTASYSKQLGKSAINALAGFSDQTFTGDFIEARNQGFPSGALQKLDAGALNPTVFGSGQEWALRSFFGRVGYIFDDKYLAEVNIRRDGSSRFGEANRYGTFPSFSLGWKLDKENFMKDVDFVDLLKLRGSWGQLGNQNIGNYGHISTISLDRAYIFNNTVNPGAAATTLSNPDIQWETSTTTDIGIDATLFGNRLSIVADYYRKVTSDILLTPPVPITLGNLAPPSQNQGKVENKGWELAVNYFGNIGTEFTYSISANWGHNDNEVLELEEEFISANKIITREGLPISSYFGHRILGIFNSDAEAQDVATFGVQPGGAAHSAGDFIYADENGDGVVNADDRVVIGNTNIENTFGGTITMQYKGFDFRAMFQGILGRDIEDGVFGTDGIRGNGNVLKRFLNRWTPENTNTSVPRVAAGVNYNTSLFVGPPLSNLINDASYLRLKTIEFGYSLPLETIEKFGFSKVRFYVAGQNLLTISNFVDGFDPEDSLQFNDVNDSFPQAKTVSVGFNIGF